MKRMAQIAMVALLALSPIAASAASQTMVPRQVFTAQAYETPFTVIIYYNPGSPETRLMVVRPSTAAYFQTMSNMDLATRSQVVVNMTAQMIARDCGGQDRVESFGQMTLSKDPDSNDDPAREHPSNLTWIYTCR